MERSRTSLSQGSPSHFDDSPPPPGESPDQLARRVLFSEQLEEKLRPLPLLEGGPEPHPPCDLKGKTLQPSRPPHLRFARPGEARPALPSRPGLVDEMNRGVLLHFFANHELLAAELMALALLKFPEAPAAFRQGLAETLREEQRHTRWYLARMKECGVEFGQYPLSPYFWEAVSPMESPIDYVSRLSLTFEQANLDYAKHFAQLLDEAGDRKSASILKRIYADEISHVGYGLRWFRQWKDPEESDWSALQRRLPFPLSPSRAKGNRTHFNVEGRRAAGFDEDYIRRLSLFERSKGRTPNIYLFNPDAEQQAARWPYAYHPDAKRTAVLEDLELLVAFLARRDDVVLLRRLPSEAHLEKLASCGLGLPELERLSPDGGVDPNGLIVTRRWNHLRPWALSPDLAERCAPLLSPARQDLGLPPWSQTQRALFSKLAQRHALPQWMGPSTPCGEARDLLPAAERYQGEGYEDFLLKRAYSTAGSGLVPIRAAEVSARAGQPFSEGVKQEGGLLLEPRHQRLFDFSVQYRIEQGRIRLVGFVEQIVHGVGRYRGALCRTKFCRGLDPELAHYLMADCLPLYAEDGALAADVASWAGQTNYEGPLGIDAYVYRHPSGALALRAICEINPRHTMGLVAWELKRRIAQGRDLRFNLLKVEELRPDDDQPEVDASGRLRGGSLVLTEVTPTTQYAACIRIETNSSPG